MALKPYPVSRALSLDSNFSEETTRRSERFAASSGPHLALGAYLALWGALLGATSTPVLAAPNYPQTFTVVDGVGGGVRIPAKPARPAPSKDQGGDDGGFRSLPPNILPALDRWSLLEEDAAAAGLTGNKILRVGVARSLSLTAADGVFVNHSRGRLWGAELQSSEAVGLRLHFSNIRLPQGALLAVVGNMGGQEQVSWIEAGFGQDAWSEILIGDRVRIEYFVPAAAVRPGDNQLPFLVDALHHLYRDPLMDPMISPRAGVCHNDASCNPAQAGIAKSMARVVFVKGSASYLCSGQLLNAENQDRTPYFLTANHCIPSQAIANTAQFFWNHRTASCNGIAPRWHEVPRSAVATLLSANAATDHSLLLVEGGLPEDLAWSGWTSAPAINGTSSVSLHHPSGDALKASYGANSTQSTCGGPGHLRVNWTDGPTEAGSSGAGLFRQDTQQLYGQLHCGNSACGNESFDDYGAFSSAYPILASWLKGGTDDLLEPNDSCAAALTLVPGTYTRQIAKSTDPDWYRIVVPAGKTLTVTLTFTHAFGDIDLEVMAACGQPAAATSNTVGNSETVTVVNNTLAAQMYRVRPFLYSDTRNSFTMTLSLR